MRGGESIGPRPPTPSSRRCELRCQGWTPSPTAARRTLRGTTRSSSGSYSRKPRSFSTTLSETIRSSSFAFTARGAAPNHASPTRPTSPSSRLVCETSSERSSGGSGCQSRSSSPGRLQHTRLIVIVARYRAKPSSFSTFRSRSPKTAKASGSSECGDGRGARPPPPTTHSLRAPPLRLARSVRAKWRPRTHRAKEPAPCDLFPRRRIATIPRYPLPPASSSRVFLHNLPIPTSPLRGRSPTPPQAPGRSHLPDATFPRGSVVQYDPPPPRTHPRRSDTPPFTRSAAP